MNVVLNLDGTGVGMENELLINLNATQQVAA